ncbi:hypothetical protein M0R45_027232 [Rubus argutus]|uniref:Uncharacterized protein n=1 Tax=Rubus argutus TaxID=59490 RepID=A0AAW1X1J5_RUBAR
MTNSIILFLFFKILNIYVRVCQRPRPRLSLDLENPAIQAGERWMVGANIATIFICFHHRHDFEDPQSFH